MQITTHPLLQEIQSLSQQYQHRWIDFRRSLHSIPEVAWNEEKTIFFLENAIDEILSNSDYPFKIRHFKGGLVIDLIFGSSNKTLLFRADIDALPITEETNLPFSSKHSGIMHACGHDFHMAMLLGAIDIIQKLDEKPDVNLRFVFQRAEETGLEFCGGNMLVNEGVCQGIDASYALHISSILETGIFYSKPGPFLANTQIIDIIFTCSGGHVMNPHEGSNAIDVLSDILHGLKGIESQVFDPFKQIILIPSVIQAGTASNIRPNNGSLKLALRSFLQENELVMLYERMNSKISSILAGHPTALLRSFSVTKGYPLLINEETTYENTQNLLSSIFETKVASPLFAGEDFAYYLQKTKGAYWMLGAKSGSGQDHHSAIFNPDESILYKGVIFWLLLAYESKLNR